MKKLLFICSCVFLLIVFSLVGYQVVSANEMVDQVKDIIDIQNGQEEYFSPYGYTIDNPCIILNPYDISPLTALILFETEKEVNITITIVGKNEDTTYQNTFEKSKKHYIPVYGLYADYENKVIVSYENIKKEYIIKTNPLPNDLMIKAENSVDSLTFISDDNYSYAVDQNGDVRWFLNHHYLGKITRLDNEHFLLGSDVFLSNQKPKDVLEIDLLGKIYHQYNIQEGYDGSYAEVGSSFFILSQDLLKIDKQSGVVLNQIELDNNYYSLTYDKDTNLLELSGEEGLAIKVDTLEKASKSDIIFINERSNIFPLYASDDEYKIVKGIKFSNYQKTKESGKNILLIGYKKIDTNYLNYEITFKKSEDYLQITGKFTDNDQVYVILDRFLDKRVYDMNQDHLIIHHGDLKGKYSIYVKINDMIYKTNYYVIF